MLFPCLQDYIQHHNLQHKQGKQLRLGRIIGPVLVIFSFTFPISLPLGGIIQSGSIFSLLITVIAHHPCKTCLLTACGYFCSQILHEAHGLKSVADSATGGDVANHSTVTQYSRTKPSFFKLLTGAWE